MDYAHTYERDTFYDLSQKGILELPKSIRDHFGRAKPKVRVTTNSKTGEAIAQIIKVRVADMDIYSPQTLFDWRISVNVEMKIEGDFRQLIEPGDAGRSNHDRNKDRLSYKHLQYQIDLTQVTPADVSSSCFLDNGPYGYIIVGTDVECRRRPRPKKNMNSKLKSQAKKSERKASWLATAR